MSFWGVKTVVQPDQKPSVYDFEDGPENLEESNDDLNDETFGVDIDQPDTNFDFAGNTAKVADTLDEEHFTHSRNQKHPTVPSTISQSPTDGPSLQPLASLWGNVAQQQQVSRQAPKMMSLEEVESQMMGGGAPLPGPQMHQPAPPSMMPFPGMQPQYLPAVNPYGIGFPQGPSDAVGSNLNMGMPPPPHMVSNAPAAFPPSTAPSASNISIAEQQQQQQQQQQQSGNDKSAPYAFVRPEKPPPLDELRKEVSRAKTSPENPRKHEENGHSRELSFNTKLNGLMTQWDKNFIMRLQLQQMVTEDPYNEDFYYQVHCAIQNRTNPQQPLNALAKTYLFQAGQKGGRYRRGHNIDPLKRMQQQVQRAVASAREHPKREQFQAEGALGTISVGSGKRPRKTLNISTTANALQQSLEGKEYSSDNGLYAQHQKDLLRNIEKVYTSLLEIESAERSKPDDSEAIKIWEDELEKKVEEMWNRLQVLAPVDAANDQPFILMLAHDKGMKLIPRVFRHIDSKQKLTILTRVAAHLDQLDGVKNGSCKDGVLKAKTRESIELFSQTVLPPLVQLISESSYDVVIGLLDIILTSSNIEHLITTKIGLALLTVLASRAELINQEQNVDAQDVENWSSTFNNLFSKVSGHLVSMFPARNVDDSYVWHFLASLAVAAQLEHQRILVDEVRQKIFGTMNEAKTLPTEVGAVKISNLNLFLNVMGLNATTTAITELS